MRLGELPADQVELCEDDLEVCGGGIGRARRDGDRGFAQVPREVVADLDEQKYLGQTRDRPSVPILDAGGSQTGLFEQVFIPRNADGEGQDGLVGDLDGDGIRDANERDGWRGTEAVTEDDRYMFGKKTVASIGISFSF